MNQVDIMNQIPEDIVGHIISFICDKRGYHYIDYKRRKRKNTFRMKRILAEIILFHSDYGGDMRILKPNRTQGQKRKTFLNNLKDGKPTVNYHTGLYMNIHWERGWIKTMWELEEAMIKDMKIWCMSRLRELGPHYVGKDNGRKKWYEESINQYQNNWQDTYRRIVNKSNSEADKRKSSRRMLNNNVIESSKKWNQSMAAGANSLL
jgi:hypothetical protein